MTGGFSAARVSGVLALVMAAWLLPGGTPAHAVCDPASADNVTATCSGVTVDQNGTAGYGTINDDNVTVTVLPGASVTGTNDGIVLGTNAAIINSGSISGTVFGVEVANTITSLTNFGSISGMNDGVVANVITSLTNSGSISAGDSGINATNITSLVNTGSIVGGTDGILGGTITSLSNFGLIQGGNNAIHENGGGDTLLTLGPGSILIGGIDLGGGGGNTLNVLNGLSIANTFDPTGGPQIITTNGAPFAVSGNQVAVADPTNLSVQDEVLTGLTGGIFSTVQNRLNGFGQGGVSGVTSNPRPAYVGGAKSAQSAMIDDPYRQGWVQGFGSYRLQRGQEGPAVDTDIRLGGVVSGLDGAIGAGRRAGVFFGGSWGNVDADYDSQETDVESVFGGFYARRLMGSTFADFALTVGYSDYDQERRVANNLVAGGLETATADYDGWFVSPEVTLTRPMWAGQQRFEKSLTLRYAGLFLDGFTETGTAAPMTVDDHDIHVLQARTQLTMPIVHEGADGSRRKSAFYVGLEGRANVGDGDVSGALLAQNIAFDPGGEDVVAAAFAGLLFERTSAGGTSLYGSIEGQVETGGGRQATAKGGVRFRF